MADSLLEPNNDILEKLDFVAMSDIGQQRDENQDKYEVIEGENFKLFVVCDGMGGVSGGEIASRIVVTYLKENLTGETIENNVDRLSQCIIEANQKVFQYGMEHEEVKGLGTTITALLVTKHGTWFVNVGDSRIYKFESKDKLKQITTDNTVLNELVNTGTVLKEQVINHPVANMLTKTVGQGDGLVVDFGRLGFLNKGDTFILCSDGLYNMVPESDMAKIISKYPANEAVNELIKTANKNGGHDNITVLQVNVSEQKVVYKRNVVQEVFQDEKKPNIEKTSKKILSSSSNIKNLNDTVHYSTQYEEDDDKDEMQYAQTKKGLHLKYIEIRTILLILLSLSLIIFVIHICNTRNEKNNNLDSDLKYVSEVKHTFTYDFKFNDSLVNFSDNDITHKLLLQEQKDYQDIISIYEAGKILDDEKIKEEIQSLENTQIFLEKKYEFLKQEVENLKAYKGKNVIAVGREIAREDDNVKKLQDDYVTLTYSLLDKSQENVNLAREREEKLFEIEKAENVYLKSKYQDLRKQAGDILNKKEEVKLKLQALKLKNEFAIAMQNDDKSKVEEFVSKIKLYKKRVDMKLSALNKETN